MPLLPRFFTSSSRRINLHFLKRIAIRALKYLVLRLTRLITRYPRLVALFGFVSGLGSFFLVERDQEQFAQLVSLLMLASWAWLTLESLLHKGVARLFKLRMPEPLLKFLTQLVHQESLFFVIPFFVITATWNSAQAFFVCLLFAMAAISIIDPLYYRWLAKHRWLYFFYHGFTAFVVLLVALPIIAHIPTAKAYVWSLGIAIILALLNVVRDLPYRYWRRAAIAGVLVLFTTIGGTLLRAWVPPANLWLTQIAIAESLDVEERTPEAKMDVIPTRRFQQGVYAYTSVHAPRGLKERIYHAWYFEGRLVDKIPLNISGGRDEGYRVWTHKKNFPPNPMGAWRIDVVTEGKQLIGRLRFKVISGEYRDSADATSALENTEIFNPSPERPFIRYILDELQAMIAAMNIEWTPQGDTPEPEQFHSQ